MTVDPDHFVITNPLAGTRPRADNLEQDKQLNQELFTDAKEVKEHALSIRGERTRTLDLACPR